MGQAERRQHDDVRPHGDNVGVAEALHAARRQLDARTRQLERSEAKFRDVIERNADAIVVVDAAGTIRFANKVAADLFGQPIERLVGYSFGFPMVAGETTELDLRVSGETRVAEMRVVESEWEGETACIASLHDVTDRKRAEQNARRLIREQAARAAAEASAKRLQFLLETSTLLSASLDYRATLATLSRLCVREIADWTVIFGVNEDGSPARLDIAHRDPENAAIANELRDIPIEPRSDDPVLDVLRTRRPTLVNDVTDDALRSMTGSARELELARKLGISSYMLVPMIAGDRPLGAIAFICADPSRHYGESDVKLAEDIARRAALAVDRARLYAEAQRANKTKADFLAVVSHDLRTPLTAIIGYADLLSMGIPEPIADAPRERIDRMRTSARHLLYLLNELLAFARLDAGGVKAELRAVDVRTVVDEAAKVIERLAEERGLGFALEVPDQAVTAHTDPDKLRQILLNLAGNAVKYTRAGEVRVSLDARDGQVELRVRDTGDGIASEHLDRIFEPFYQVEPSLLISGETGSTGGTGLGLSVVKQLATLLGGRISVESTPGVGSVFILSLPTSNSITAEDAENAENAEEPKPLF